MKIQAPQHEQLDFQVFFGGVTHCQNQVAVPIVVPGKRCSFYLLLHVEIQAKSHCR